MPRIKKSAPLPGSTNCTLLTLRTSKSHALYEQRKRINPFFLLLALFLVMRNHKWRSLYVLRFVQVLPAKFYGLPETLLILLLLGNLLMIRPLLLLIRQPHSNFINIAAVLRGILLLLLLLRGLVVWVADLSPNWAKTLMGRRAACDGERAQFGLVLNPLSVTPSLILTPDCWSSGERVRIRHRSQHPLRLQLLLSLHENVLRNQAGHLKMQ